MTIWIFNLRVCDHEKISSLIKSLLLFQDQLVKPEDFVLYRPRSLGGLGLVHVETKALALQVRSFLETAVNVKFIRNIFHEALYKWHIENDRSIPNPGITPYYPDAFFQKINLVKEEGLLNIKTMDSATWYKVLLENFVTHRVIDSGVRELIPCRIERINPTLEWDNTWSLATTPGLPSELTSFNWKMIHDLLPTRERLFRLGMPDISSSLCDLCSLDTEDNLQHALPQCPFNTACDFLLTALRPVVPHVLPAQIVLLQLDVDLDCHLPISFIISSVLSQTWSSRKMKKIFTLHSIRAELEAGVQILRKSRHWKSAQKIDDILSKVDL